KLPATYITQKWETFFPIDQYTESEADEQGYENTATVDKKSVFPHTLNMESLYHSPFSNTLTRQFAEEAVISENLGGGDVTDFLAISFSGTDYAGHAYGPQSKEVQDVYVRLDREIEQLLNFLDKRV